MTLDDISYVIIKTIICYFFLIFTLKIMGKREVGKLSTFDIVVFFLISELFSLSLNEPQNSILHSLIPVSIIVILQLISAFLSLKFKKVRNVMEGGSTFIIYKGKIMQKEMKKQRYNVEDLMSQLRSKDIQLPEEVEFAILENTGVLNIIKKSDCKLNYPDPIILDGKIDQMALKRIGKDEKYIYVELAKQGISKVEDVFMALDLVDGFLILPFEDTQNINQVK